jgi:(1->4)-alpha-D-glucan 1-alpha-D-glucosylmutase
MKRSNGRNLRIPASVYRLQLNAEFPIKKARKILPYLKELGVDAVYCSPYFKAFTSHGYDVTDPNAFNPLLGTEEEFQHFCGEIKELGLMHLADIIPNHMGIKGGQNVWWQDVLENGPYSEYAGFFDINWSPEKRELQDRVLLPILATSYARALENHDIKLRYEEGKFTLHYADYLLPVAPHTYAMLLANNLDLLKTTYQAIDPEWLAFQELIEFYSKFPLATQQRGIKKEEGRERLDSLFKQSRKLRKHISSQLLLLNGKKPNEKSTLSSLDFFDKFLEAQFYRLSFWRVASHEINYRRFFNINELVSIRIEKEKVLESHHRWLFELLKKNQIQGIRIDHPDGLYDPVRYFERLRQKAYVFTVTEKILERKEELPRDWDVEGTVGYEYLNVLNGVFVQQENEKLLTDIYEDFIGKKWDFEEILYLSKLSFAKHEMVSETEALGLQLDRLSETNLEYRDFTRHDLTQAIAEVIAAFPVYRSYIAPQGAVSKRDQHYIKVAIEKAKHRLRTLDDSIFEFLEKVLLLQAKVRPEEEEGYRAFTLHFQQLTAPVMAKGFEDTAFYVYNRLLSLNEVGGDPTHFGYSIGEFHSHNQQKKEKWPYGLLATSTHDTKRSEDVRMRLNVLSEIPERWNLELKKWSLLNNKHKKGEISPNTEYYIYQTLLGVWPRTPIKKGHYKPFCQRIWQVILKSIREAKEKTSWLHPNRAYEETVESFFFGILADRRSNHFVKVFTDFHRLIDRYGGWNSLSQTALKIASPGVVDLFQGNELLTYRLVDPDNRVNVNFDVRKKVLGYLSEAKIEELFQVDDLSSAKLLVQTKGLHSRRVHKELFLDGEYIPLKTSGLRKDHVIAFLRKTEKELLIALAARFFSKLSDAEEERPLGPQAWGDTEVILPFYWKKTFLTDLFTEKRREVKKRGETYFLPLAEVFEHLPVSFLYGENLE